MTIPCGNLWITLFRLSCQFKICLRRGFLGMQVMKMFMPLLSPAAGVLHWVLPEGSLLAAGDLIARLELDNPAAVTRAAPFAGAFPPLAPPVLESEGVDAWFTGALQAAQMVMAGAYAGSYTGRAIQI